MAKQLYIKAKDTYKEADEFNLIRTPLGLNAEQAMPADRRAPGPDQGPSEYDGGTGIEADSN